LNGESKLFVANCVQVLPNGNVSKVFNLDPQKKLFFIRFSKPKCYIYYDKKAPHIKTWFWSVTKKTFIDLT